jgi:hypothetical protein
MPITALPDPPSRSSPSTFAAKADALLGALPTFVTEANALQTDVNSKQSTTSAAAATATTQAGIATTQAGIATTKASEASTSASNALVSETALKSRWLTAKASDPALDDAGNALVAGIAYFNTNLLRVRIYNGSAWQDAVGSTTADFTVVRELKTATAGQTLFNLTNSYSVGTNSIMLYLNGVRLMPSDYTETSSNSVTLAVAANLNDELLVEIGVVSSGTTAVAGLTSFNPTGDITSTNVQSAITELGSIVTSATSSINQKLFYFGSM